MIYGADDGERFAPGVLAAEAGRAAYDAIVRATADAERGAVQAIATAPINKEALRLAGLPWNGHTDLLAHLTGAAHVAMMFYSDELRVVLATVHVAARRRPGAADAVPDGTDDRADGVRAAEIRQGRAADRGGGPESARRGTRAVRPRGGDGDRPAIARCRERGIDVTGPFPGDTVFVRARRGEFDVVIACTTIRG